MKQGYLLILMLLVLGATATTAAAQSLGPVQLKNAADICSEQFPERAITGVVIESDGQVVIACGLTGKEGSSNLPCPKLIVNNSSNWNVDSNGCAIPKPPNPAVPSVDSAKNAPKTESGTASTESFWQKASKVTSVPERVLKFLVALIGLAVVIFGRKKVRGFRRARKTPTPKQLLANTTALAPEKED